MSRVGAKDWLVNTEYSVDDFCIVNDDIEYRCTIAHNSGAVFSDTNREVWVGQGAVPLNGGNGITIDTSDNINIGGLFDNIELEGNGSWFDLVMTKDGRDHYTEFWMQDNVAYIQTEDDILNKLAAITFNSSGGNAYTFFEVKDGTNQIALSLSTNGGFIIIDDIFNKGIAYSLDYSANYTDRSLPDVEWVNNRLIGQKTILNTAISEIIAPLNNSLIIQTASGITTTLPITPTTGDYFIITNRSGGVNTISGNTNNIEGVASQTLNDTESASLIFTGTEWIIV